MTEYEETLQHCKTLIDFQKELDYQIDVLGYNLGDSFPQYIIGRMNKFKEETGKELINKVVVCDEHSLGIIYWSGLKHVHVLRQLQAKGAPVKVLPYSEPIGGFKDIRRASIKDFDQYNISLENIWEKIIARHHHIRKQIQDE